MQSIYDDDTEYLLSPENLFLYLFGICEPNVFGMIQLNNGNATIFVDLPDPTKTFWEKFKSLEEYNEEFEIDEAVSLENLGTFLKEKV